MSAHEWKEKIDAYVDGELPDQELREFDAHLAACPDCAREALNRTQLKRAMRAAAMRFTPPEDLRQQIRQSIAPKRPRASFLTRPALVIGVAALVVLAIAVPSAIFVQKTAREQTLGELVDLHVSALASPNPVDVVSSDRHTVKPWFQGKLPFTFNLPEVEGSPYKLRGGRLVYFRGQPAAQLIYALNKHELSVFIVQDTGAPPGLADEQKNGFSTESWTAGAIHYVILSDTGGGDVHALGDLLRRAQHP